MNKLNQDKTVNTSVLEAKLKIMYQIYLTNPTGALEKEIAMLQFDIAKYNNMLN